MVEDDSALTDMEAALIAIVGHLQHKGDVVYGANINRELTRIREREIKPGALHTALLNMTRKGLLASEKHEPAPPRGGRGMLTYTVTDKAISEFAEWKARVEKLMAFTSNAREVSEGAEGGHVSKHTARGKAEIKR